MSGIRGKNTKPEMMIRRGLHARGFRYRLHCKLPGKPDICLPKYKAVIFVHGCFWHGHDCHLFKWPSTRPEFWRDKIGRNRAVDERTLVALRTDGWRTARVWECALKGKHRHPADMTLDCLARWLNSDAVDLQVEGSSDIAGLQPS